MTRARFFLLDSMTVSISTSPQVSETADVLRFLHRFSDLMSTGSNSDNLLRAARLLEAHVDMVKESNALLQVERVRGDANSQLRKALEEKLAGLETDVFGLEAEISVLKSQLSETQLRLNEGTLEAEAKQSELLRRAGEAERELAAAQDELARKAASDTHILVPVTALHLARAQFESLASAFEKAGNIVSQVMCEASASSLDRVITDAGGVEDENRSQHAA